MHQWIRAQAPQQHSNVAFASTCIDGIDRYVDADLFANPHETLHVCHACGVLAGKSDDQMRRDVARAQRAATDGDIELQLRSKSAPVQDGRRHRRARSGG